MSKCWCHVLVGTSLLVGCATGPAYCAPTDNPVSSAAGAPQTESGLYLKVRLSKPVKMSKLKLGDAVEGSLLRDVYSADQKLFLAASGVRLTVDHLEKRKRSWNDHWPGVVKLFTPRHEKYPVFKTAVIAQAGRESALQVSLISVSRMREVHAQAKGKAGKASSSENGAVEISNPDAKKLNTPTMILEAFGADSSPPPNDSSESDEPDSIAPITIPTGTHGRILLLGNVSASKSQPGDAIQARLIEPITLNSKVVVPAGSLFEGNVVKKTPPRWLSRSGSLYLTFTQLTLPHGNRLPITASLAGAELDRRSHTRIDSEGQLRGERPGKAWMVINLGVTAGLAKEADDTFQIVFQAIVSTATDASTAGTARIVSSCISGIYMATRKGRDVVLPRFTEMDISLDRAVSLSGAAAVEMPIAIASGK